MKVAEW